MHDVSSATSVRPSECREECGKPSGEFCHDWRVIRGHSDRDLFFQLDEGGRRGRDNKLFKRRFRLNIRKYVVATELLVTGIHYLQVV